MYTSDFTRALAVAEITAPAYACEARTTGPLVRSSTRSNAFASSLRDVKGIGGAITLNPLACKGRMTLLQLEPSAHAPWTMTMVNASLLPFIRSLVRSAGSGSSDSSIPSVRFVGKNTRALGYPQRTPGEECGSSRDPPKRFSGELFQYPTIHFRSGEVTK